MKNTDLIFGTVQTGRNFSTLWKNLLSSASKKKSTITFTPKKNCALS
jgi:hypothetical protein